MFVYFARHGESEANVLKIFANTPGKYGLTDKGRTQAAQLAENLIGEGITRAYASPLLRAQQTCDIVCSRLGIGAFGTMDALREFSVGNHEGSCDPAAWQEYAEVESAWLGGDHSANIGGGECLNDISARFMPAMYSLVEEFGHTDERILLVGHGGTYACMLPQLLINVDMAFAQEHRFAPASFVKAEYADGRFVCLSWTGIAPPQPDPFTGYALGNG